MSETMTVLPMQLIAAKKFVCGDSQKLSLSPRAASVVTNVPHEVAVRHCHFSVSPDTQRNIVFDHVNWDTEYLTDTYSDARDCSLLKMNVWLRIRNGTTYKFKSIDNDVNNVLNYFEMEGPVEELTTWALTRLLFTLDIIRYTKKTDKKTWVDFVTIEDDKCQVLYDCVATVCGDAPEHHEFGPPRCGGAFIAARDLHIDGLVVSDSDCTNERALTEKPTFWAQWKSPFAPVSVEEHADAHEFAIFVREQELEIDKTPSDDNYDESESGEDEE